MKRDFNLIRSILLDVEKKLPEEALSKFTYEDYEKTIVAEHVRLLIEAEYLEGAVAKKGHQCRSFIIYRLTWEGHNFLDNAKNETIWKKVMADAEDKGMSLSMSVLNRLLGKAAEKYMGLT